MEEIPSTSVRFKNRIPLDHGGHGDVFVAEYQHKTVAVKKLSVKGALGSAERSRDLAILRNEVNVLQETRHPNVVLFYGANLKEDPPFIVIEYAEKGSLEQVLRKETNLGVRHKLQFAEQIAKGMLCLHSRPCRPGILHMDLKPDNILVCANYAIKLCDFGLSRILSTDGAVRTVGGKGSPHYLSPESIQAEAGSNHCRVTFKSDVFSFGMLLYRMFANEHPFKNLVSSQLYDSWAQIMRARELHPTWRPPIPSMPTVPPELWTLVQQCWAHNPAARPTMEEALKQLMLIRAALEGCPISELASQLPLDLNGIYHDTPPPFPTLVGTLPATSSPLPLRVATHPAPSPTTRLPTPPTKPSRRRLPRCYARRIYSPFEEKPHPNLPPSIHSSLSSPRSSTSNQTPKCPCPPTETTPFSEAPACVIFPHTSLGVGSATSVNLRPPSPEGHQPPSPAGPHRPSSPHHQQQPFQSSQPFQTLQTFQHQRPSQPPQVFPSPPAPFQPWQPQQFSKPFNFCPPQLYHLQPSQSPTQPSQQRQPSPPYQPPPQPPLSTQPSTLSTDSLATISSLTSFLSALSTFPPSPSHAMCPHPCTPTPPASSAFLPPFATRSNPAPHSQAPPLFAPSSEFHIDPQPIPHPSTTTSLPHLPPRPSFTPSLVSADSGAPTALPSLNDVLPPLSTPYNIPPASSVQHNPCTLPPSTHINLTPRTHLQLDSHTISHQPTDYSPPSPPTSAGLPSPFAFQPPSPLALTPLTAPPDLNALISHYPQLSEAELLTYWDLFCQVDSNGDGMASKQEVEAAVIAGDTKEDLQRLLRVYHKLQSKLTFSDFVALLANNTDTDQAEDQMQVQGRRGVRGGALKGMEELPSLGDVPILVLLKAALKRLLPQGPRRPAPNRPVPTAVY